MEQLAAPYGRFALAHGVDRPGTGARRRFARALEQLFEHDRVVEALVLGSKEQSQPRFLLSEIVEAVQCVLLLRLVQLFEIFLPKRFPSASPRPHTPWKKNERSRITRFRC
jgi:hypothetical protein